MAARRYAQFVVKITKYCNLRCTYCYEYRELGNKARMSRAALGRMFENIATHAVVHRFDWVGFVWHGGEPFLVPLEEYDAIATLQRDIFGALDVRNSVQTNLTVLTDRHLEFLKSKRFFSSLGVSFDVYGDQRVDAHGRQRSQTVLAHMQKLIENGIDFGAIAVVARNTLAHVPAIYRFYDQLGVTCRFLPFYLSAFDEQVAHHAISRGELVAALNAVFDAWLASANATPAEPVDEYLDYAIAYLTGRRVRRYDKEHGEYVFVVDLDCGVWGAGDAYVRERMYGNLLETDFGAILGSKARQAAVDAARRRLERHCRTCPYFGACPGFYVADASPQQEAYLADSGCPVRAAIAHIVGTFERTGLSEVVARTARKPSRNLALSVNL